MTPLEPRVFDTDADLGRFLADRILDDIAEAAHRNVRYTLGCPGGRSLRSTYVALGTAARRRLNVDLSPLVIAMMDDYVVSTSSGFHQVPDSAHFSCRRFAYEEIVGSLSAVPGAPTVDRVWFPDPTDPPAYDRRLLDAGGIDMFLLASGASDGHVGFNPPGSSENGSTRIVTLAETTRRDNLHTFPEFDAIGNVPTHGVTVGLGSIVVLSRSVTMVCTGSHKATTVKRVIEARDFDPSWPATIIHRCPSRELLVDRAAMNAESPPPTSARDLEDPTIESNRT